VPRGIEAELLCPFEYLGVPDLIDYAQIPWRSGRFSDEELERAVETRARAINAFEQWQKHGGARTLAFCVSQRHADFMASFFAERGVATVAVHAGETSSPRALSLERLRDGDLKVLFAVDMFNEGVDVPAIDTVLMLRPTGSKTVWLQQLGRGLRRCEGKQRLQVIDYIGNHRSFLQHVEALAATLGSGRGAAAFLRALSADEVALPKGCGVTYELQAQQILSALTAPQGKALALRSWFEAYRELHGRRPRALEALHEGVDLRDLGAAHAGWLDFARSEAALAEPEALALAAAGDWLRAVERDASLTSGHDMITLLALLACGGLSGSVSVDALTDACQALARKARRVRDALGVDVDDHAALGRLIEPSLERWQSLGDSGGRSFFRRERGAWRWRPTTSALSVEAASALQALTRELSEWRLVAYLNRREETVESPAVDAARAIEPWHRYQRQDIAPAFGLVFNRASWNAGYVHAAGHVFLLVTLKKVKSDPGSAYEDRFASPTEFHWQSQTSMQRSDLKSRRIGNHQADGIALHLFVRDQKVQRGKSRPFVYCGQVDFASWEHDQPISVTFRLRQAVPEALRAELGVPE
jgi:hypothetical protein